MNSDPDRLQTKIAQLDTEELLDRVTAYRAGMEPQAIECMERELHQRGVNAARIADQREEYEKTCLFLPDGVAQMCSFCRAPAVKEGWGWHRLMGRVPILPRWLRCCDKHVSRL